jgi:ABC-type transporter Mla subunit MlaD
LQAQRTETAKLKEQLLQAGLQHARALKEAITAGEAKVEEAKKQLAEAQDKLRQELEEERKLRKLEKERNDQLLLVQASVGQFIKGLDDKAQSMYLAFA